MATEVVMPQMGESIAEGTITRWLKKVGERVERDEPLFEISTDKVDAEIPSPAAGTLQEVRFKEGDTVEVNKVVAYIGEAGEAAALCVLAHGRLVRRDVDAVDLVARDVALDPLYLRPHLAQHAAGLLRNSLQLLRGQIARAGYFALD